ncbi:MAG: DUF1838 family protein [Emcibacteraceae bacterium]|nr:DUF1838 family protein [Emcibacteraceae bacterium]
MNILKNIKKVASGILLSACAVSTSMADQIDLSTPEGVIEATRKVYCRSADEKPMYYRFEGTAFGRKRGEADKTLFLVSGMSTRQCVTVKDEVKGDGYKLVTREVMLYIDPKTGKAMDKWHNPYLQRDVDVMHVENDPVNQRPSFPYDAEGKPAARWYGKEIGDSWFMNLTVPLFYHNPMQGDYQKYVGGAYHATEMFSFIGKTADLLDGDKDVANVDVAWSRISEWLPWMEMQGREGLFYVNAIGKSVETFDGLPDVIKDYINEHVPEYKTPPPGDDMRPNATTWTVFKDRNDPERLPFGGHN